MNRPRVPVNALDRHIAPMQAGLASIAAEVIAGGHYVLGPGVAQFETDFASYCGVDHCIGVANGTDALELSLKAVGVRVGDYVVVAPNAAMYGTSAVLACGAVPLFVDVDEHTATLSAASLRSVLATATERPRALIVTHLYGRLADMPPILDVCREYGVPVVEDCAQAHGAMRDGRRAGAWGDIASFSFYPTKNLGALGDGGAVVTRDASLAVRVRQLRQYGWSNKYTNAIAGGRNSRLDELQARMLSYMLPHLDGWNARRREVSNRYSSGIDNPRIATPQPAGTDYVAHLYVVRSEARDELRLHLEAEGIQTEIHYPVPDHRQPCFAGAFDDLSLPVTEWLARTALTLPCFPEIDDAEVQRVIDACNRF